MKTFLSQEKTFKYVILVISDKCYGIKLLTTGRLFRFLQLKTKYVNFVNFK